MARNFFRISTENNPVMWDSKTFYIPEAKGLKSQEHLSLTGVYCVSGSHNKRPCLQVSSGFRATVLKCAFEASLVSLPEMFNNKFKKYLSLWLHCK